MASSGMLHSAALVRTDVSEELGASFIRVTRIGELGTRNTFWGPLLTWGREVESPITGSVLL
jgi:hypothetical protein